MAGFNETIKPQSPAERPDADLDLSDYSRLMTEQARERGFDFYEAMMEFRKSLLASYSEDELRQSALYHILIGSTPETYHNKSASDAINQLIKTYLDGLRD